MRRNRAAVHLPMRKLIRHTCGYALDLLCRATGHRFCMTLGAKSWHLLND